MHHFNKICPVSNTGIYVFTDLDGTLLGHHDYQYKPVLPLIERLSEQGIPVILNSSKTFAEISEWLERLNLKPPFIAENGGVIYFSKDDPNNKRVLGCDYQSIREVLSDIRATHPWQFKGFGDCTVDDVVAMTSLDKASAADAMQRAVSEPIKWLDSDENLQAFKKELEKFQLRLLKGGRFYHVMAHHDKASALNWVVNQDQSCTMEQPDTEKSSLADKVFAKSPYVIALGDGENDRQMLEEADLSLILPSASGHNLQIDGESVFTAVKPSPFGWVELVESKLLSQISQN